jgi:hypothetical protein
MSLLFPFKPELPDGLQSSQLVQGSIDRDLVVSHPDSRFFSESYWVCSLCRGVPRFPIILEACSHCFCLPCIKTHIVIAGRLLEHGNEATCPNCREVYDSRAIIPYDCWQQLGKCAFNSVQVRCPATECEFVGSVAHLLKHEKTKCLQRKVACPGAYCTYIGTVSELESTHIIACEKVMVNCLQCGLPWLYSKRNLHNCQRSLMQALDLVIVMAKMSGAALPETIIPGIGGEVSTAIPSSEPTPSLDDTYSEVQDASSIEPWHRTTPPTSRVNDQTPTAPIRHVRTRARVSNVYSAVNLMGALMDE